MADGSDDLRVPLAIESRPTQRTIAEITGLAITTVSRALSGAPEIALKTRKRVAEVADQIGYVPDRAAQRLRTGKTNVISLILGPHQEIMEFGNSLIMGINAALRGSSYHLNITPYFDQEEPIKPVHHIVQNRLADGILFTSTEVRDSRVQFLNEHGFPFVSHGRSDFDHAYVDYDNDAFAQQAVERLASRGYKKLCIILPPHQYMFRKHLESGFRRTVASLGLDSEIPESISLDSTPEAIREWAKERANQPACPDGFVCPGESSYLAIMAGLRDSGKDCGRGFVAKSTSGFLEQLSPSVDQIYEDIKEAGRLIATQLVDEINQRPRRTMPLLMPEPRFQSVAIMRGQEQTSAANG